MQPTAENIFKSSIAAAHETLTRLDALQPAVGSAADLIVQCLTTGHKMLVYGNGGSAADAADFCTEFACRFDDDRRPYPALNLSSDGSLLTATANDYGFDEVFARQLRAFGSSGDVAIAITTSGNSNNIQHALTTAKELGLGSIALLGRSGGSCTGIANVDLVVPGTSTARIQEAHKFLLHVLCEIAETRLPTS
jgi:phosphoheptose isomerase